MAKLKSAKVSTVKHLESFGEPTGDHFERIKQFLKSEVNPADIFVYSIKLCDNLVDRDGEFFSHDALVQLKDMFVGVPGIVDHKWSSGNQHSRIYQTELITEKADGSENDTLEPYEYIVGYAYTLNNEKNKSLIEDIQAGILSEVSIGFKDDQQTKVTVSDVDVNRIDHISDVYEWSFVAVPAQRLARVVKSAKQEEEDGMSFKAAREKLVSLKSVAGVDQTAITSILSVLDDAEKSEGDVVKGLRAQLKSAVDDAEVKGQKIKEMEDEKRSTTLESAIKSALEGLKPVNDKAGEMARGIAEKGISLGEDGSPQGLDEVKSDLADNYGFLFAQGDGGIEEKSEDGQGASAEDDEDDEVIKKSDQEPDEDLKTKLAAVANKTKSLGFTVGSSASTKGAQPAKKKLGIQF